jgi:hypothetical protein
MDSMRDNPPSVEIYPLWHQMVRDCGVIAMRHEADYVPRFAQRRTPLSGSFAIVMLRAALASGSLSIPRR